MVEARSGPESRPEQRRLRLQAQICRFAGGVGREAGGICEVGDGPSEAEKGL
jgi:hypothetical protein